MTKDKSLISELLTIYQGRFVVRVTVQIEGIVRATGMAMAETLEAAEDKARERAIACFHLDFLASIPPKTETIPVLPTPPETTTAHPTSSPSESNRSPTPTKFQLDFSYTPESESSTKEPESTSVGTSGRGKTKPLAVNSEPAPQETDIFGTDFAADLFTASSNANSTDRPSTVDLLSQHESLNSEPPAIAFETPQVEAQAHDLAADLQKIELKLKESKLKANDERECLETNYGKASRYELTASQARAFKRYLELYGQTTQAVKELQELGWDAKEGPKYLQAEYSKNKRHQLTERELEGFLDYLQIERDRLNVK